MALRRRLQYQSLAFNPLPLAAVVTAIATTTLSSPVIFTNRIICQSITEPVSVTEVVTVDKWFAPLNDPVRIKSGLSASAQQAFIGTVLDPDTQITQGYESRWHYPWSESVRQKQGLPAYLQQSLIQAQVPAETITTDKWFVPLSDPVRIKSGLHASKQQFFIGTTLDPDTQITQGYESRWHYPWSESVRQKRGIPAYLQQTLAQTQIPSEAITTDKWFAPLNDPVRIKAGLHASRQQFFIGTTLDPNTQIIQGYESNWHYCWSEPVRTKIGLAARLQQALIQSPPIVETVTSDKWFAPLSDPVRFRRIATSLQSPSTATPPQIFTSPSNTAAIWPDIIFNRKFIYQSRAQPSFVPETVASIKLYEPWAEPVRTKIGLRPWLQQFTAFPVQTFQPKVFTSALSSPVIFKSRLIYQAQTPRIDVSETITYDKWGYAWSEPVRQKRGLATNLQQALVHSPFVAEIVTPDKWIYGWSDPSVKAKRGLLTAQQQFTAFQLDSGQQPETVTESRWHQPWSEPVRTKIGFASRLQQTLAHSPFFFEIITVDKWIYPWSDPSVKVRAGLRTAQQQFTAFQLDNGQQPETVTESRWHQPWSEPVRNKIGIAVNLQQTLIQSPFFVEQITYDKWGYAWNDPVRIKLGLLASDQQFLISIPQGPEIITPDKWAFQWSEPSVKTKGGLLTFLQRFFTAPDQIPPAVAVTITLSATEVNTDSAFFGIASYNTAIRASVSIKEIPVIRTAATSIEEQAAIDRAAASIKEI